MKIQRKHREAARVQRPDIEEYHLSAMSGESLELWWDDQMGVKGTDAEGWCVRVIDMRGRERDVPVKGKRDSSWSTILRNVSRALN